MSERKIKVDVWSDVVCPWCYIGKRRLEAALAQFAHRDAVEVRWHSFELDPRAPRSYEGEGSQVERLAHKYGIEVAAAQEMIDRVTRVAAEDGLTFDLAHARRGNTLDAHRLLHFAAAHGRQTALKERLMRAYFTERLPIADPDTLVRLAAEVGLDEAEARAVVVGDAYTAAVRTDEAQAAASGIRGVPFFLLDGKYGISGAQSSELLHEALERVWQEAEPGESRV